MSLDLELLRDASHGRLRAVLPAFGGKVVGSTDRAALRQAGIAPLATRESELAKDEIDFVEAGTDSLAPALAFDLGGAL